MYIYSSDAINCKGRNWRKHRYNTEFWIYISLLDINDHRPNKVTQRHIVALVLCWSLSISITSVPCTVHTAEKLRNAYPVFEGAKSEPGVNTTLPFADPVSAWDSITLFLNPETINLVSLYKFAYESTKQLFIMNIQHRSILSVLVRAGRTSNTTWPELWRNWHETRIA